MPVVAGARGGRVRRIGVALAAGTALLAFLFALPQPGSRGDDARAPAFAIRDVRVFDGERLLPGRTVLVRDGRIVEVAESVAVPDGVEVIDGRGRTLLPGLIDAHVHTYGSVLADALNFGVTTVLDMFCDPGVLRELQPLRDGLAPRRHADLYSAGVLATAPGGHGTQFGVPVPTLQTPAEAPAWVDARIAEGSDFIKIVYEPAGAWGATPPFPSLDRDTVAALVAATHARGRLAVVHVSRLEPAREALAAGADGLVHVHSDREADRALLELAVARGAFVIPTLAVIAAFDGRAGSGGRHESVLLAADPELRPFLTTEQRANLERPLGLGLDVFRIDRALASVRALHAAGVDLFAGSDAPNPGTASGASLHHELELLVRAGLTPQAALRAATAAPADRFGLADRGRVAPGMRADLVLVAGDPTVDIRVTRRIERIWKNGAVIERQRYPEAP